MRSETCRPASLRACCTLRTTSRAMPSAISSSLSVDVEHDDRVAGGERLADDAGLRVEAELPLAGFEHVIRDAHAAAAELLEAAVLRRCEHALHRRAEARAGGARVHLELEARPRRRSTRRGERLSRSPRRAAALRSARATRRPGRRSSSRRAAGARARSPSRAACARRSRRRARGPSRRRASRRPAASRRRASRRGARSPRR